MRIRPIDIFLLVLVAGVVGLMVHTPQPPEHRPDGRLIVTYWEKWTKFEGEAIKLVVKRFNERQDRLFVKLLTVSEIENKVKVATAGGNPPDITGLYNFNVAPFADQGALMCLDDFCAEAGLDEDHYIPVYWEIGRHRGKTWALPTTPATVALHMNRTMLREAGVPDRAPRTIAELDDWAERLTLVRARVDGDVRELPWREFRAIESAPDRDVEFVEFVRMGFLPTEPGWFNWFWPAWFGGALMDDDGISADAPANLAAMRWFKSYADTYGLKRILKFQGGFGNFSTRENAFFNGRVAMELQGVWLANFIDRYAPADFDWVAVPFPSVAPSKDPVSIAEADMIAIPAGARHPREAFEFVRFLQSQEGMELLCRHQWKHSPLAEVSDDFYRSHPNKFIRLFYDLAWSPRVCTRPRIGIWQEYEKALTTAYDNVWENVETPEQALASVQARMELRYAAEVRRHERLGVGP